MCKEKQERDPLACVSSIQDQFYRRGWRWTEEIFDNGDVYIRFTLSKWCHALSPDSPYQLRPYGWGRFHRADAWRKAEEFLLKEQGSLFDVARLRAYKESFKDQPNNESTPPSVVDQHDLNILQRQI